MRKCCVAMVMRSGKRAVSSWRLAAAELGARRDRQAAALHKLSPDGRKMTRALNSLIGMLKMHQLLLRACSSWHHQRQRGAFSRWRAEMEKASRIDKEGWRQQL